MPHHALEATLTRPLTAAELHQAQNRLLLAPNDNSTRLMAVVRARTPDRALHRLRRQLDELLPIDVVTTHYPDPGGQVLVNITFPPAADPVIRHAAATQGQRPHIFVQQAVRRALTQQARRDAKFLDRTVQELLTRADAVHLLAALGRALPPTPGDLSC
ncbi:hypothetical protein ACWCO9_23090 [Streptomyces sp. NPDC001937]